MARFPKIVMTSLELFSLVHRQLREKFLPFLFEIIPSYHPTCTMPDQFDDNYKLPQHENYSHENRAPLLFSFFSNASDDIKNSNSLSSFKGHTLYSYF